MSAEWSGEGCPEPADKYDIRTSDHMASCPRCGPRTGIWKAPNTSKENR